MDPANEKGLGKQDAVIFCIPVSESFFGSVRTKYGRWLLLNIQLLLTHRRYLNNPTLLTGCEVRAHRTRHNPPTCHPSWSLEQQPQASVYHYLHNHQSTPPNAHLHIHSPPETPLLFSMDHMVVAVQSSVIPIIVYNHLGRPHKIDGFSKLTIRLTYVCVW